MTEDRDIRCLLHFTQIANMPSIMQYGLLSRQKLGELGVLAHASDDYRLDNNNEVVSVSISRINQMMFESKRRKSRGSSWIILIISPEILWTHSCKFCWRNAAKNEIKNHRGWRGGYWAFQKMFDVDSNMQNSLHPRFPTDPEAEVQVLESIEAKYILGAIVEHSLVVERVQKYLDSLGDMKKREVIIEKYYFS